MRHLLVKQVKELAIIRPHSWQFLDHIVENEVDFRWSRKADHWVVVN